MKLLNTDSEIYIPDGTLLPDALRRTTHMCVAAHQDDIEIMAFDGIADCYGEKDKWFFGAAVTNGTGSVKTGKYAGYGDHDFKMVRYVEQKKAADTGRYGALALLDYTSAESKDPANTALAGELAVLIKEAGPEILYTHNLADKHMTHVSVAIRTIQAVRSLPKSERPGKLYGCEVWRSLDWMLDKDKVVFDVDRYTDLAWALLHIFESQISGAKKYDEAAMARRLSNSTFYDSRETDSSKALSYAMDLTPLILDDSLDMAIYVKSFIDRLADEVTGNINKLIKKER
jgi:LmbE family N-acetylglucosaminyl deacetylase